MYQKPLAVYTDFDELDVTPGKALLEEHGWQVRLLGTTDADQIVAAAQDATALLVGYATIDADTIRQLPNLKIIALLSMGFDNVDVQAATDQGIWVTNVPGAATHEVATHALALALSITRGITTFNADVRGGQWSIVSSKLPKALHETRCGVLGFGKIGRAFANLASGIFSSVVAYDPFVETVTDDEAAAGISLAPLDTVLAQADVLSLHLPLNDATTGMLDAEALARLPESAVVVNVSRGELVDEQALLAALESGQLGGAGLDVLTEEPAGADHPLLSHPRVVVTPHIGFLSERTFEMYPLMQARNVLSWQTKNRPDHPLNDVESGH